MKRSSNYFCEIEFNILDRESIGEGRSGIIYGNPRLICKGEFDTIIPNEISKVFKHGGNKEAEENFNIYNIFSDDLYKANKYMFLPKRIADIDIPENLNYGDLSTKHVIYNLGLNSDYIKKLNLQYENVNDYYSIFLPYKNIIKAIFYLNSKSFMHGDLKFENIAVEQIDGKYKLIDLGLFIIKKEDFKDQYMEFRMPVGSVFRIFNLHNREVLFKNREILRTKKLFKSVETEMNSLKIFLEEIKIIDEKFKDKILSVIDFNIENNEKYKEYTISDIALKIDIFNFCIFVLILSLNKLTKNSKIIKKMKVFINFCINPEEILTKNNVLTKYDEFLNNIKN